MVNSGQLTWSTKGSGSQSFRNHDTIEVIGDNIVPGLETLHATPNSNKEARTSPSGYISRSTISSPVPVGSPALLSGAELRRTVQGFPALKRVAAILPPLSSISSHALPNFAPLSSFPLPRTALQPASSSGSPKLFGNALQREIQSSPLLSTFHGQLKVVLSPGGFEWVFTAWKGLLLFACILCLCIFPNRFHIVQLPSRQFGCLPW